MLFPNELWKLIQSFSPILYQQRKHCETILSYYDDPNILNGSYYYVNNRNILSKLFEKALRYNQCVKHLNEADSSFRTAITEFTKHGKVYEHMMDDIESLMVHMWLQKFH